MPSYARKHQLGSSLIYHVLNRGNGRFAIFHSDTDYQHFIQLLKEYTQAFNTKIYHWVLMPNHYHLLLEIEKPEWLSKMMAGLNRAYTHYYHKTYGTSGYLWQGRFKAQPVQKERYLIACGRYIERNPVQAQIVSAACDYPYSSARFHCLGKHDALTSADPAIDEFGQDSIQRQKTYTEFLRNFDLEQEQLFEDFEHPLGSKEFMQKLLKINGRYMPRRKGRLPERFVAQPVGNDIIS